MSTAEYLPGPWSAAVRPCFLALVAPDAPDGTARSLWDASGDGIVACLGVLAHDGFAGLPAFALAHLDGDRAHLALRGSVTAEVATASGTRVVRSGDVGTWTEQVLGDVTSVRLVVDAAQDAQGVALPLVDGVVRASAVHVGTSPRSSADAPAAPAPDAVGESQDPIDTGVPSAPALVVVPAFASSEASPAGPLASDEPVAAVPAADESAADASPEVPADEVLADEAPVDEASVDEAAVDEAASHEPSAEPSAEQDSEAASAPEPETRQDAATEVLAAVEATPEDEPAPSGQTPGLVALGAGEADVESTVDDVRTLVGPASQDDHDGMTILSTDLAQIREQLPAWAAQWPNEGATPGPYAVPTATVAPAQAPRIVLSTGMDVTLDRTVLLGRAPQVARVTNRELPRLVAVPSPQQDISRTHAEVRAEGDHVLVTDLHSTNGVHVSRQGEGARRLHPGEASVVADGEVVDLGDGVTFTVERGQ